MPRSTTRRTRFSPKLLEFLEAEGSEKWTQKLWAAPKSLFERNLPIREYLDRFQEDAAHGIKIRRIDPGRFEEALRQLQLRQQAEGGMK